MKFGAGIFSIEHLPYSFENAKFFNSLKTKIYLGLPQWGVPEWKGSFYTKNCSAKNFLKEYSELLNCVEVSSTFYADVSKNTLRKWKEMVPDDFRFLPKWPQRITHQLRLKNCTKDLINFIDVITELDHKLGVTLLQLPPEFSIEYKRNLFQFLCQIPDSFPLSLEFRHKSWFKDFHVYDKLANFLASKNISMVCTDTPSRRDVFHLSFTGNCNVIRYVSDENFETDRVRLNQWKEYLDSLDQGGEIFFALHQPNNEKTPELISLLSPTIYNKIKKRIEVSQISLKI